jgi:hypothetical protein
MDFTARRQRLNIPVAPLVAALVGGVTALAFTLMPVGILEDFVLDSGVASIMPAAEPPLGTTARAVLILAGGGGIALVTWFTLFLVLGARAIVIQRQGQEDGEEPPLVLRRADAHPDAPARRPLFANRDLGTPFLDVRANRPVHVTADLPEAAEQADVESALAPPPAERAIPADLDTPLAAFDPDAIPASPVAAWPPRRAPLVDTPRPQKGAADPDSPLAPFNPDAIPAAPATWFLNRARPVDTPLPQDGAADLDPPAPVNSDPIPAAPISPLPIRAPLPMRASEVQPLRQQVFDPGERFETFELNPPVRSPEPAPEPVSPSALAPMPMSPLARAPEQMSPLARPPQQMSPSAPARPRDSARVETDPSASIHALLDRLERVVGRREVMAPPPPARPDSLQETLGTLRRLANGA